MNRLEYLNATYLFESEAKIERIEAHEKGTAALLDATIFHPQGGGQPADQGRIEGKNGALNVQDVRMDDEGNVWHYGTTEIEGIQENEDVALKLDGEKRKLHARLHTAGHLIDHAMERSGIEGLKPTKGFHFPDGPYVEYKGHLEEANEWKPELERIAQELVEADLPVEARELSPEEASEAGIQAPEGKPARAVRIGDFPFIGCGGTHVKRTSEIGRIQVRKVKSKKGKTKVGYEVE